MIILKIIACAFSMSFCFMCVSSLAGFMIEPFFYTSSAQFDDPIEWLQKKFAYFLFFWIFFCWTCAILAAKLKDFGKLADFFVNLFLPTVAVLIVSPLVGIAIATVLGWCGGDLVISIFAAYILALLVVNRVLKQIYPPKS
ncbi:hypothetical protein [uncultured Campylobacter sp.]|uniref:hypothetical protein n=1 Tax=uncultured Campylobacter sp. TaxID=218934 RepID=UPI0026215F60|nr:hypothetical protein [uncultured Campylobacter sp.]